MKQYTEQEVFNKVWDHFVVKGNPLSYDESRGICYYEKYPDGPRCAIGLFVPDDVIVHLRHGTVGGVSMKSSAQELFTEFSAESMGLGLVDVVFLEDLQKAHDGARGETDPQYREALSIRTKLTCLAERYDLWVPGNNIIVVTRHKALIDLLIERGIVPADCTVIDHARPEDVKGKHVFGVLPLSLAALAASVTEIPLALTPDDRGKELDLSRMREIAGEAVTYVVQRTT